MNNPQKMRSSACVSLSNLSIRYPVPRFRFQSFGYGAVDVQKTGGNISNDKQTTIEALKGLTFDIGTGERVGILGKNGAGKSTLLRTISGIYEPSEGSISVVGKIGSMLDINSGFDPTRTGLYNISLRALFMDIEKELLHDMIDEIVEFTELGEYINMPLFTYSTGMKARLSFAVATCFPADIIIMDEWLVTGDASFREKAEKHLREYVNKAGILIMATHSEGQLKRVCKRALILDQGIVAFDGDVDAAISFRGNMK